MSKKKQTEAEEVKEEKTEEDRVMSEILDTMETLLNHIGRKDK